MSEHAIIAARASVMIYDDANKRWVPSGSSGGISKVQIYQHSANHTFRVVGRKTNDHEVVINCAIVKSLKYNQATPTFHQWRDSRQVYGLNFASKEDAENFSHAMITALDTLNSGGSAYRQPAPVCPPPQPPQPAQPQPMHNIYAQGNIGGGPQDPDDRIQRDDPPTHKRQPSGGKPMVPIQQPQAPPQPPSAPAAPTPPAAPPAPPAPPAAPPAPPAAPPAPPAPPAAPAAPPAPPAPPSAPSGGAPPPPPPSSVPAPPSEGTANQGGLAAALQGAKLKKTQRPEEKDDPGAVVSGGGGGRGNSGGGGGGGGGSGGGHFDMLSEMQRKFKERKAKAENPGQGQGDNTDSAPAPAPVSMPNPSTPSSSPDVRRPWEKNTGNGAPGRSSQVNGSESPKPMRKRNTSLTGQEQVGSVNGGGNLSGDMESFKQEILAEMKKEINKAKNEILDAIRQELSHR